MTDYFAFIDIGAAGSWQRHNDKDKAVAKVLANFKRDFGRLFKIDGTKVIVNVVDVGDGDEVVVSDRGITIDGKPFTGTIEKIAHEYPTPTRGRAKK